MAVVVNASVFKTSCATGPMRDSDSKLHTRVTKQPAEHHVHISKHQEESFLQCGLVKDGHSHQRQRRRDLPVHILRPKYELLQQRENVWVICRTSSFPSLPATKSATAAGSSGRDSSGGGSGCGAASTAAEAAASCQQQQHLINHKLHQRDCHPFA